MLEAIGAGLASLATPQAMAFMVIGVVYGLVVGILPGLGGIVAIALLLPFTYGYEISATLALLLGAHIATIWGGSVTSILFQVPGAAKSLALVFDGHPMTQQGQASRALGASATAALLGGVFGAIFLAISIPVVRPVMLALGPSEYLMLALWGLTIIATFSEGSLLKGMIATALGIMVAFVGMDPITGTPRFWFGIIYLLDGISFPVAMIGLFAVAEMIKLYVKGETIVNRVAGAEQSSVLDGVKDTIKHRWLVLRSSLLGLWIGELPGVGASIGGIAAYAQAVQTSKTPERFGKGAVEGVIAPDATLGANEGGGRRNSETRARREEGLRAGVRAGDGRVGDGVGAADGLEYLRRVARRDEGGGRASPARSGRPGGRARDGPAVAAGEGAVYEVLRESGRVGDGAHDGQAPGHSRRSPQDDRAGKRDDRDRSPPQVPSPLWGEA